MAPSVLIEGCNLTLRQGTGIATYARNLNAAVRAAGYKTNVLVDVNRSLDANDPALNEILAFDATPSDNSSKLRKLIFGSPFIPARKVVLTGAVAESPGAFRDFDAIQAVTNLDRLARKHFARY